MIDPDHSEQDRIPLASRGETPPSAPPQAGRRAFRRVKPGSARSDAAALFTWPLVFYALVLGLICIFLIPLTSLWWIVPVLGVAAPVALAIVAGSRAESGGPERPRQSDGGDPERSHDSGTMIDVRFSPSPAVTGDHSPAPREEAEALSHAIAPAPLAEPLSEREREVLTLLASGRTTAETARDLYVSVGTIKSHTGNIYRKLGTKNRAQAIARARQLGLLP